MNQNDFANMTIALAGLFQAVTLLRELTQTGRLPEPAYAACMESILQLDAVNVTAIYGGLDRLALGLKKIVETFAPAQRIDRLQQRYLLSIIHLQKKLARYPKLVQQLTTRLTQTRKQAAYFSAIHPIVVANLADIYLQTVSPFRFRITLICNPRIMQVKENGDKMRALLLAGIRATVLWRQMGGSRLQLLFARRRICATAAQLLNQIEKEPV